MGKSWSNVHAELKNLVVETELSPGDADKFTIKLAELADAVVEASEARARELLSTREENGTLKSKNAELERRVKYLESDVQNRIKAHEELQDKAGNAKRLVLNQSQFIVDNVL